MPMDEEPIAGQWYEDLNEGTVFEVIDFDEDIGTVEIRQEDEDPEIVDLDAWYAMDLTPIEGPGDFQGGALSDSDLALHESDSTLAADGGFIDDDEDEDDDDWD